MTKATEEMLALADKIEYAIKTEGEITLFETNGTRVVYVLRTLAAQSAGEPPKAQQPVAWQVKGSRDQWLHVHPVQIDELRSAGRELRPLYAALSVPPGDQAREEIIKAAIGVNHAVEQTGDHVQWFPALAKLRSALRVSKGQ